VRTKLIKLVQGPPPLHVAGCRALLGLLAALCATLALAAGASGDAPSLAGPCPGSGCFNIASSSRIAFDESTKKLYAIDPSAGVVNRYDADGKPDGIQLAAAGMSFQAGTESCDAIAVDNSSDALTKGNIYVVSGSAKELLAFAPADGKLLWRIASSEPCGVAVDTAGHLWVSDYNTGIQQLEPADGSAIAGAHIAGTGNDGMLSFDSAGDFIASEWNGSPHKFSPSGTESLFFEPGSASAEVTVDVATDRVYSAVSAKGVYAWENSGVLVTGHFIPPNAFVYEPFDPAVFGISADSAGRKLYASTVSGEVQVFNIQERAVAVTAVGTGEGTVECEGNEASFFPCASSYYEGEMTVKAKAEIGSEIAGWTVNGSPVCGTASTCKVALDVNSTVEVDFAEVKHTLKVNKVGGGEGTVTSEPAGISCGSACATQSVEFKGEEIIVLKATPAAHSQFTGWSGGGCSGTAPCLIELSADTEVTATFVKATHTVEATVTGAGSVSADSGPIAACTGSGGTCSGTYDEGGEVVLTATPSAHNQFSGWTGCTSVEGAVCKLTVPSANAKVTASFVAITHTLTLTNAGTGSGSLTCNGAACASSYPEGTTILLAASAASGSTFAGFSGAGCSATPCSLTLEADAAVTATFNANPVPPPSEEGKKAGPPPPPPPVSGCVVPKLAGRALGQARTALKAAKCALGKVTQPKAKKGKKLGPLVVKSSSPAAGKKLAAGSKVNLTLAPKPKHKKKH
jgi:hypothetical protein